MNDTLSTIDAAEVAKFAQLAEQWWDPNGPLASLHRFNPIRLKFLRDAAAEHFHRDGRSLHPFRGLSLLDLGCGGGLLSEPLARIGFSVLGCDAAEQNIAAAERHARGAALPLSYRCATAEALAAEQQTFDMILAMEIVEHVADLKAFLCASVKLLRPGGLLFIATINKTLKSLALAKIAAEYILRWLPPGTHDWNRFVRPEKLGATVRECGGYIRRTQGVVFNPLTWDWRLSDDTQVNYIIVASQQLENDRHA